MTIAECYAVLEIAPGASLEDARKAYKLLAAVWHPDRFTAGSKLHKEAEEKLRRINEAYQTLKDHLAAGGGTGAPDSSAASAESEAYVDWQCLYLGGDVRIRPFSKLERGSRAAIVRVGNEGITIATLTHDGIDETVHYPAETIRWIDTRGTTWAAADASFDPETYRANLVIGEESVKVGALDPEKIIRRFEAKLQFRNTYFSKLFQKRVRERFCPVNATQQCIEERKRRAAERRAAEERRRQEEAERRRKQAAEQRTAAGQRSNGEDVRRAEANAVGASVVIGGILCLVLGVAIAAIVDDNATTDDRKVSGRATTTDVTNSVQEIPSEERTRQEVRRVVNDANDSDTDDYDPETLSRLVDAGFEAHSRGEYATAEAKYLEVLNHEPRHLDAICYLAWLRATCPDREFRNGSEGVLLALDLLELASESREVEWFDYCVVAAASAEYGDFDKAVEWQTLAVQLAPSEEKANARELLNLYRSGRPFRNRPD